MDCCISPKGWKEDAKTREDFCFARTFETTSYSPPLHVTLLTDYLSLLDLCRDSDCSAGVPDMHLFCEYRELY